MNTFITRLKPIFSLARTRNSRGFTRFNNMPAAFRCASVMLSILAGAGVIQAQQKADPLTITNTGNVGIGTTTPKNKLSVEGNADVSGNVGIGMKLSVDGNADFNGNVGIGTKTPANRLSVTGNADFNGAVGIGTSSLGTSKFRIANSSSDFAHFRFGAAGAGEFEFVGWANGWNINSKTTGKNLHLNRDAETNSDVLIGRSGKEMIVKGDTGNVGIGTATPANKLSVIGNVNFDGNVGIGTTTPTNAKLQISGAIDSYVTQYGYLKSSGQTGNYSAFTKINYSVWASHNIGAIEFHSFSDTRIKNIQGRSDSATDLRTLLGIEVTDYRYKDVIGRGNGPYKKVTGQQVEKVFPQAVNKHTEVVPDIYQQASIQDGWVALATDLKRGERVRLITAKGEEGIFEVLEVAQDRFRIDFKPTRNRIFVYGREVKDFLTVDYGAISMLNVSATQQIKKEKDKEVKALQEENAILRDQLAEQERRLAAIEALLLSVNKPVAGAASLKKVE